MYDTAAAEVTVTAAVSTFIVLDPSTYAGVKYLKIRSGTSGTPVTQSAERKITLLVRTV